MTRQEFLQQEIEKYSRKIETYQAMISEWRSELGVDTSSLQSPTGPESTDKKKDHGAGSPSSLIHGMVFFGKSQPEAAKAFLEMVKYPLTTAQILEGVEKGGVTIGGKTPATKKQNLYTILNRSDEFGRVKPDTWGIVGWPGIKKSTDQAAGEEGESIEKATATEVKPS